LADWGKYLYYKIHVILGAGMRQVKSWNFKNMSPDAINNNNFCGPCTGKLKEFFPAAAGN